MSNTMKSLHRLREHARRVSETQLYEARLGWERQRQRLDGVQNTIQEARAQTDPLDVISLSTWHSFRLRQEMAERREIARLAQRVREVDAAETTHAVRVRDELAMQSVLEGIKVAALAEETRQEGLLMDEIGGRLRWSP